MTDKHNDKAHHRIVTAISLTFAFLLYLLARYGLVGDAMQKYATMYLVIMLIILSIRAVLTETGVRRQRLPFEKKMMGGENTVK